MWTAFWISIWGWVVKTKVAKVGVGALSGTGAIAAVLALVNSKDASVREYVDLKHENVTIQIGNLAKNQNKAQDRMMNLLIKIDDRVYKLKDILLKQTK